MTTLQELIDAADGRDPSAVEITIGLADDDIPFPGDMCNYMPPAGVWLHIAHVEPILNLGPQDNALHLYCELRVEDQDGAE